MGKRHVHVVNVPKLATVGLLVLTTAGMMGLVYLLSGRAYAVETHPMRELVARVLGAGREPLSSGALLSFLMPVLGNALLFVPWGFLAFIALDAPHRPRRFSYLMTVVGAVVFAAAMHFWQEFLPTRVTSLSDTVANALGAFAGAALGHARRSVRVVFDI